MQIILATLFWLSVTRVLAGLICDFEGSYNRGSLCDWNFEPPEAKGGFRVVGGIVPNGSNGKLLFPLY